jgi:hypothetical protein
LKAWLVLLTGAFLVQRALVLEPSCMFFGNTKLLLRSILIGLSSSSRSSSRARNMSLLSASAEAPKRRMLFLHGQFPPPECYINKLASAWLETVENGGWECKAASRLAILSLSSHEAESTEWKQTGGRGGRRGEQCIASFIPFSKRMWPRWS